MNDHDRRNNYERGPTKVVLRYSTSAGYCQALFVLALLADAAGVVLHPNAQPVFLPLTMHVCS